MANRADNVLVSYANDAGLTPVRFDSLNETTNLNTQNSTMKRAVLIAAIAIFGLSSSYLSARTVLAGWEVSGLANSGPSPFAATASNPNLTIGGFTKGLGVTNTTTGNVWGGNSWTNLGVLPSETQAINGNKYLTFTVTPNPGYFVSVTNISKFFVTKSGTGPASGELQYSTNGTTFVDVTNLSYGIQGTAISAANIGTFDLSGVAALQNLNSNTTATIRIVNWGGTSFPGTWYIANGNASGSDFELSGTVISSGVAPHITDISPSNIVATAGTTVSITVTASGDPATNTWYHITGGVTNVITGATTATLTLTNLLNASAGGYYVALANATGSDTSSVVSVTVTGDPHIAAQPVNTYGLLNGTAYFSVSAFGTAPLTYQWYLVDNSGNLTTLSNGPQGSGSIAAGAAASLLTISGLQPADPTNFAVVVANSYGSVTSAIVSLLSVSNSATLVFWDFNGSEFTNTALNPSCVVNPTPYLGVGAASPVGSCNTPGSSPFIATTSGDPNDGMGFTSHLPPWSWGTQSYPLTGGNKQNGIQFNFSTAGAKNIKVYYESRVSPTASDYERLQYTTNGTDWIDYPTSTTFGGIAGVGSGGWLPFSYDLTGFPGAANNPSFGLRVVTEYQSSATYGISGNTNYIGTANSYGAAGTVTYDLLTVTAEAITNNNLPPVISAFPDTNTLDYVPITIPFTVSDDTTPPDQLTYAATSLDPGTVNPIFSFSGSGNNRSLTITPNSIVDSIDAAPIMITITDTNGDAAAAWFTLTLISSNLPPTNTLTSLKATNTLANTSITIPFSVGDDHSPSNALLYSVSSANNTIVPAANIILNGTNTAKPTVTITPALNQLGVGVVSVTVNDNDLLEPKSTTANIAFMVRPSTNIVAIDYFNYDNNGALDSVAVSGGFWKHLSGIFGQLRTSGGAAIVDTLDNTENLQTPLLGAPYRTNSGGALYSSYIINLDPTKMPTLNGTYVTTFNDGSGITGLYEDMVLLATNGAAPGYYRVGILNSTNTTPTTAVTATMFPADLAPGSNYVIVTRVVLSNGVSTLWVNPGDQSSPSVSDSIRAVPLSNLADFELRESGANAGSVNLSHLRIGTTFDAVFPVLHIAPAAPNVIVTWSDPTLGIQSATNVTGPFTDVLPASSPYTNSASAGQTFFRFKR
jgi:hypothetical protein